MPLGQIRRNAPAIGKGIDLIRRRCILRGRISGAVDLVSAVQDLSAAPEVSEAGNIVNQVGYSLLFLLLAAWCLNQTRPTIAACTTGLDHHAAVVRDCVGYLLGTVLSARRLPLLLSPGLGGHGATAAEEHSALQRCLAVVVLIVLRRAMSASFCCPERRFTRRPISSNRNFSRRLARCIRHKNEASAAMVVFIFLGLFVARVRSVSAASRSSCSR